MKIPRKQSDILVKTYLKYHDFIKGLTENQKQDDKFLLKETVKIFYNITETELKKFKYQTILDMYQIIENILNTKPQLQKTFMFNNVEYGLIPNINDMTLAEMVDCDTDDIIRQICILYRPIVQKKNGKYTIKEYEADISIYNELKETLTLDIYLGFISFFLSISQALLNSTLQYMEKQAQGITAEQRSNLDRFGDGIRSLYNYQTTTF